VLDTLMAVAKEAGRSPAQVALRWLLQRPGVTAPIIGARTMDQLDDNIGATALTLDEGQMARLDDASDVPLPYPHDFLANAAKRR
ncbi:MAG: aldo/keto reductase, partial [Chloroflexota bacterium]|nr:aldo/keto reductase [Chloroflexota bacterium]